MTTASDRTADERPSLGESLPPLREWLRVAAIGLCMGTADAVPGVSGGTIALIAGIYERLVAAITAVTPTRAIRFLRAIAPTGGGPSTREAVAVLDEVDVWFLVALVSGVFVAIVAVTGVVDWASEEAPVPLFGVFFGLIGASAVVLLREIRIRSPAEIAAALAGFVVAFLASGASETFETGGLPVVFLAGVVAMSAMILPGLSGSLLLIVLGQYVFMSDTLHEFLGALGDAAGGGPTGPVVDHGLVVVAFVLGGVVGLLTIARVVRRALDANRSVTLAFLVALIVGALRAPIERLPAEVEGFAWTTDVALAFAGAAAVGAAVVFVVDWYAVDLDLESA